jgi:hypothetical protein
MRGSTKLDIFENQSIKIIFQICPQISMQQIKQTERFS